MKLVICIFLLFTGALELSAEDFYIAQTQQGSGSGNDAANAKALTFFNTAGNWGAGAGKISPGDTVHLVGTVTTKLDFQTSGTSGNPITLLFETNAKMTSAAWDNNGAINIFQLNFITIDGGANGIIENTDNGPALGHQVVDSIGIKAQSAQNLTVKNLTVQNIWVRVSGTNTLGGATAGISNQDGNGVGTANFAVQNCTVHDVYIGVQWDVSGAGSNYSVTGSTFYNCAWGIGTADRGPSTAMSSVSATGNLFYNWTNWQETATNAFHANGWHCYTAGGGHITGVTFSGNTLGPGWGGSYQTAGLFCEGDVRTITAYNNLFKCNSTEFAGNGYIAITTQVTTATTHSLYNNTFSGNWTGEAFHLWGSTTGNAITFNVKNNVQNNGGTGTAIANYNNAGVTINSDYNDWYNNGAGIEFSNSSNTSGSFLSFAAWKTATGGDAHSITTNPTLNGSYGLTGGSPAIGSGFDLSSTFTTDFNGVTRTVPWDMGAFKFSNGPTATITSPTSSPSYSTGSSPLLGLAGTASAISPATLVTILWVNTTNGASGNAVGTTSWSVPSIALNAGVNNVQVIAIDSNSNQSPPALLAVTLNTGTLRKPLNPQKARLFLAP